MELRKQARLVVTAMRGVLFFALALLMLGAAPAVGAQDIDPTSCGHFETYEDAQAALEADPGLASALDPDGDAIACEDAFGVGDGDIPVDQMTCSDFDTQDAAQAHHDASSASQQDILDPDGDGTACEALLGGNEGEEVPVVDLLSCGHFASQEAAQAAYDDPTTPNREHLDGDGDGIACEDAFEADGDDAETTAPSAANVSQLPSTGSSPAARDSGMLVWLSGAAALVSAMAGLTVRAHLATKRA